jgi:hypothetical protein
MAEGLYQLYGLDAPRLKITANDTKLTLLGVFSQFISKSSTNFPCYQLFKLL